MPLPGRWIDFVPGGLRSVASAQITIPNLVKFHRRKLTPPFGNINPKLADAIGNLLTKLDGSAKGGVILGIARARSSDPKIKPIPLLFIGVGEGIDDLQPFAASEFVEALVD